MSSSVAFSDDHLSGHIHDDYPDFLNTLKRSFLAQTDPSERVFATDASDLFETFLHNIPQRDRQVYTCHTCRTFMRNYGGLVTIDQTGRTKPLLWSDSEHVPAYFLPAVQAVAKAVEKAKVTGVFLTKSKTWGCAQNEHWTHMAVVPPAHLIYKKQIKTPAQTMAEKLEDFRNVSRALVDFSVQSLETAVTLLRSEALYRSEKVLGAAEWLLALRATKERGNRRANLIWRAIASAPAGFCHPRSSMIGTLLEDIEAGKKFADVENRFRAKMDPTLYQRPQVAPSTQNIKRAEEIVEKLGIAASLKRRYARLDDLQTLWRPKVDVPSTGVFGHLSAKGDTKPGSIYVPKKAITAEKFRRTVLPTAEKIDVLIPMIGNFTAMVTAVDPTAPPILQWDHEEQRNPVSSYVYKPPLTANQWGLVASTYCEVTAVTLSPTMWNDNPSEHFTHAIIFVLDGARDSNWRTSGAALFPEILKAELREVRATIEAYSKSAQIDGYADSSACGLLVTAGNQTPVTVRVTTGNTQTVYQIDRWD